MDEDEDEQGGVDHGIMNTIRRFQMYHAGGRLRPGDLSISTYDTHVNCQSVQYLVDFLSEDTSQVTDLELHSFSLLQPSDGSLDILRDLFANTASLTKVGLFGCDFGSVDEASRLIAAFQTNRSITDLSICYINNLEDTPLGNCISGVLQNNPHLQRLALHGWISEDALLALHPAFRSSHNLKILDLSFCHLEDEDLGLVVDALVGNTTMETLNISNNCIKSLDNITRLVEVTQLKTIRADENHPIYDDQESVNNFILVLRLHTSLEEYGNIDLDDYPQHEDAVTEIDNILARNCSLRHANALLALQPQTGLPFGSKNGILPVAMAKMGSSSSLGASAIFKILQTRPAILEKQLRRPAAAATSSSVLATDAPATRGQKRQRL